MRIAILSDIHANREAFEAVLAAVRRLEPDRLVLLGDIVGYGPEPGFCVDAARELVAAGALCIRGNHDEAAVHGPTGMTPNAHEAALWTRAQLSTEQSAFLGDLPLTAELDGTLFVHASARDPTAWHYVRDVRGAEACLAATDARMVICGHTHLPTIFYARPGREPVAFIPLRNVPAPLSAVHRHVVVVGAVGQPRDGDPAACFALLDTQAPEVTMVRAPYDTQETARKIKAAGLPDWLGLRLQIGR
ncbi:metallophosphatase family protein [Bosea sp. Tri-44]|uniref:metallophosphoesterase family protein n=1 Tax=Bosea sp. Tri-44 TaxID=1972137 RepID=UPI00100DB0AC|nr:metallophosphoesterase family protein [Bosea sp. Tri-44]RXT53490.1 metallophosphatase family protein [Bosea sp. Tri-44]